MASTSSSEDRNYNLRNTGRPRGSSGRATEPLTHNKLPAVREEENESETSEEAGSDLEDGPRDDAEVVNAGQGLGGRTKPPPPLILPKKMRDAHKILVAQVKAFTNDFHIAHREKDTAIYFKTQEGKDAFIASYKTTHDMYTYSGRNAKSWALVVRGFPDDIEEEELQEELATLHLETTKVFKMKKTKTPLFLVVLGSKTTPAQLNKTHQFVAHTKVRWDWYRSSNNSIQCRTCQRWGHSSSNCFVKTPRCLKCAEPHPTHCCQKDASTPATCANCGGDHPASYQGCPAHVAYKEARDKASADSRNRQRPKPNTRRVPARAFIPAPPPVSNPWQSAPTQPASSPEVARTEERDFPPLRTTATPPRAHPPLDQEGRPMQPPGSPRPVSGAPDQPLAYARGSPQPARTLQETPQSESEEQVGPARLEPPPAHPQIHGWTRLSAIVSKINRELDIDWMAQQLEIFYNAIKSATDPFEHIAAVAAYQEAITNGRRH